MILDKDCYLPLEQINGKIEVLNYEDTDSVEIQVQMCKVYDWYDTAFTENVVARVKDGILKFTLSNGFEKGLYAIIAVSLKDVVIFGRLNDTENCKTAFAISDKTNVNTLELYRSILNKREIYINKPKLYFEDKTTSSYDVLMFVKNLHISNIAYYDMIQVYPYNYLKLTGEVDYINEFIKNNTDINIQVNKKSFETSVPSAVFIITNVMAHTYEEAEEYAMKKAEALNSIFTVLLHSHGTIFAIMTNGKKERKYKTTILDTRYKGNLLHLAENGFNIRHYYECLNSGQSYLSVYLKLLNDAQNENERMMKYYRYWNILEGLATRKKFSNNPMLSWDGQAIKTKKGIVHVGNEALNTVFELVRQNCGHVKATDFVRELDNIKTPKEFLSICYQRRNCCVHQGECYKDDSSICLKDKDYMCRCRNSNVIDMTKPLGWQDAVLRKLQDITFQIILNELNALCGKAIHSSTLINDVI
ncbi:MAG: hypothetical protein II978_02405 [Clostridia bacterium]|nr:hypothetical protein [Clostridia bacterium]